MSFQSRTIETLVSNPVGRAAFKVVQPVIHYARRRANPHVPLDRAIAKVAYKDRQIAVQHRRSNASDLLAVEQCFAQGQYDMPIGAHGALIERIHQEIVAAGRKPLIIDCGANIGCSVL